MKWLRNLQIVPLLLIFFCGSSVGQEPINVEGICLFESSHLGEALYGFPPDANSEAFIRNIATLAGKQFSFTVRAANVPHLAGAETANGNILLYDPYVLEGLKKANGRDWRTTIVLAHELGHFASGHNFIIDSRLRVEEELEADRFAGLILFRLGASIENVRLATDAFTTGFGSPDFPKREARVAAVLEGWHDGKVDSGRGSDFDGEAPNIPKFPSWPPPKASASVDITKLLSARGMSRTRYMDIANRLTSALDQAHYAERSFYSIPDGFALVTRIEKINQDGTSKVGDERWSVNDPQPRVFSLGSYLRALLASNPGYYRVIVFVVSAAPLSTSTKADASDLADWVWSGSNKLPTVVGFRDFTSEDSCTALIYEFVQHDSGTQPLLKIPGELPGMIHLQRSQIAHALGD